MPLQSGIFDSAVLADLAGQLGVSEAMTARSFIDAIKNRFGIGAVVAIGPRFARCEWTTLLRSGLCFRAVFDPGLATVGELNVLQLFNRAGSGVECLVRLAASVGGAAINIGTLWVTTSEITLTGAASPNGLQNLSVRATAGNLSAPTTGTTTQALLNAAGKQISRLVAPVAGGRGEQWSPESFIAHLPQGTGLLVVGAVVNTAYEAEAEWAEIAVTSTKITTSQQAMPGP